MTIQSSTIVSALRSALRSALAAHPRLCPNSLDELLADVSQLDDILREFRVCIWEQGSRCDYGIMSPHHKDEDGEPFWVGAFVTLDWLDQHALSTPEEFDDAYMQVAMEQGSCQLVTLPSGEMSLKYYPISYDDIR
jgi:hypothetical protein